jgi:hypothetical protein
MAFQFPRQLIGLALLLIVIVGLLRADWRIWVPALAAAFFAHRLSAAIGLLALTGTTLARLRHRAGIALAAAACVAAAVASLTIPGVLRLADWARWRGALHTTPRFPQSAVIDWLDPARVGLAWRVELHAAYAALVVGAIGTAVLAARAKRSRGAVIVAIGCCVAAFPFFVVNAESAGYRLILGALAVAPLVGALAVDGQVRARYTGGTMAIGAVVVALRVPAPLAFDPPHARYAAVVNAALRAVHDLKPGLVIAHKGLAELFTFTSGIPAMSWEPESDIDPSTIWRLATNVDAWEIIDVLETRATPAPVALPYTRALVREDVWRRFRDEAIDAPNNTRARAWSDVNPSRQRPAFLRRKR